MKQLTQLTHQNTLWILIVIACVAYALPWAFNANQTLDLNAYDLGEWLSLHPTTQQSALRLPSLLLRGQLLLLVALIAWQPSNQYRLFSIFAALLLIVAQLPPLDFIQNTGDLNQRQQFLLALSSAIIAGIGFSGVLARYRPVIIIGVAIIGVISVAGSIQQTLMLMPAYSLETQVGFGAVLMIIGYLGIGIWGALNAKEPSENGS